MKLVFAGLQAIMWLAKMRTTKEARWPAQDFLCDAMPPPAGGKVNGPA
jgi:hypothetical protein